MHLPRRSTLTPSSAKVPDTRGRLCPVPFPPTAPMYSHHRTRRFKGTLLSEPSAVLTCSEACGGTLTVSCLFVCLFTDGVRT